MGPAKRIDVLTPLLLAYPRSNMSAESIGVYALALCDIEAQVLRMAVVRCIQECRFFPSVAEVRAQAERIAEIAGGARRLSAGEAWQDAMRAVRMSERVFATPEVRRAVDIYGWRDLCVLPEKDVSVARGQFMRIYEGVLVRSKEERMLPLIAERG